MILSLHVGVPVRGERINILGGNEERKRNKLWRIVAVQVPVSLPWDLKINILKSIVRRGCEKLYKESKESHYLKINSQSYECLN